ncbi:hypothetical protein O7626_40075 [Micromonospora sp. WMMD1102]|uniref:phage tail tube protein n=1 Tax=Micromonospora sp. WMMD1102 TaxID=3016105 RepID=UPI002414E911|nr:hypothetical protein [Micromonospora sp. WMMD1102]MDG4792015.1 hypothetical protein [Micromonospora sp. WMMD1102]
MSQPVAVPADGNLRVFYVQTIATPEFPQLAELNAGTSKDVSCYITGEGFQTTLEEQVTTDDRLCSRATFEQPGRWQKQMTLSYVYNMDDPTNNVMYLTLPYLTTGFIVARWGVPYEQAWADGDLVDVYPVKAGKPMKNAPTANSMLTVTQKMFITGESIDDALVGGS